MFHWTRDPCPDFNADVVREGGRYEVTGADTHYYQRSSVSPYQLKLVRSSRLVKIDQFI